MYIVSKELPTLVKLKPPGAGGVTDNPSLIRYMAPYDFMNQTSSGISIIGPPWSRLTAYDLNAGKILWQVPNGSVTPLRRSRKEHGKRRASGRSRGHGRRIDLRGDLIGS